jgi:hypothetical protein
MKNIFSVLLMVSLLLTFFGCNKENPAKVQDQEEVLQEVIENIPVTLRIRGEGTLKFKDGSLLDVKGDTSFVLPQKGRIEKMISQNRLKKITGECDVAIVTYNIILMDDPFGWSGTGSIFVYASNIGVIGCQGQWKHAPKSCITGNNDNWIQTSVLSDSNVGNYSFDDFRFFSGPFSGCYLGIFSNCLLASFSSDRDIDFVGVQVDSYPGQQVSMTVNSIWIIVKGAIQVSWQDCGGGQS